MHNGESVFSLDQMESLNTHPSPHTTTNAGSSDGRDISASLRMCLFSLLCWAVARRCSSHTWSWDTRGQKLMGQEWPGKERETHTEQAGSLAPSLSHGTGAGLLCLNVLLWGRNEILFIEAAISQASYYLQLEHLLNWTTTRPWLGKDHCGNNTSV